MAAVDERASMVSVVTCIETIGGGKFEGVVGCCLVCYSPFGVIVVRA